MSDGRTPVTTREEVISWPVEAIREVNEERYPE